MRLVRSRPRLVGMAHYYRLRPTANIDHFTMAILAIEVFLGSLTFTGSLVAFGKLQELIPSSIKGLPNQKHHQLRAVWRGRIVRLLADDLVRKQVRLLLFPLLILLGSGVWLVPGDADRRGRHADGDFAA